MISVILVDDEQPVLDLLHKMIKQHAGFHVAGMFTKPSEALAAVSSLKPDAAFLDIEMPGMNGLELAASLTERHPELEVVMVTAFNEYAVQAFRVNAIDYLLKPVNSDEMTRCADKLKKRLSVRLSKKPEGEMRIIGFGGFEVYAPDCSEPIRFPTAKVEELLAYMYIHRHIGALKWAICEHLWPEFDPDKAEQNLHTTVYRLRKLFAEFHLPLELKLQLGSYRLTGWNRCDFIEFEENALITAGTDKHRIHALETLVALYKGPLFAGREYAWCESEKDRLERRFIAVVKHLAGLYSDEGDEPRAAELLRFLLDQSAYDEEAHEMLLQIYVKQNDKVSFLLHFNKLKERLHDELGLLPGPGILELFDRVMKNDGVLLWQGKGER